MIPSSCVLILHDQSVQAGPGSPPNSGCKKLVIKHARPLTFLGCRCLLYASLRRRTKYRSSFPPFWTAAVGAGLFYPFYLLCLSSTLLGKIRQRACLIWCIIGIAILWISDIASFWCSRAASHRRCFPDAVDSWLSSGNLPRWCVLLPGPAYGGLPNCPFCPITGTRVPHPTFRRFARKRLWTGPKSYEKFGLKHGEAGASLKRTLNFHLRRFLVPAIYALLQQVHPQDQTFMYVHYRKSTMNCEFSPSTEPNILGVHWIFIDKRLLYRAL